MELLLSKSLLKKRIRELAARLAKKKNLHLVIILKGGRPFGMALRQEIQRISAAKIQTFFIIARSYKGTSSSGKVRISGNLGKKLEGKGILLVDDILDTGLTIREVSSYLKRRKKVKSIITCVLLKKRRKSLLQPDFKGFTIPSRFVVGFGLDHNQKYRSLPDIRVMK